MFEDIFLRKKAIRKRRQRDLCDIAIKWTILRKILAN